MLEEFKVKVSKLTNEQLESVIQCSLDLSRQKWDILMQELNKRNNI